MVFGMIIGITGGIGSGKSYVLSIMEEQFGCLVLEADGIAQELEQPSGECFPLILQLFGREILDFDGQIDRKKLGGIVFSDRKQLEQLNQIVHPIVKEKIRERIRLSQVEQPKRDIVIEAALLLEDHYDSICDTIWYVYANRKVRKRRLRELRGYSEEKIAAVMKNQLSEEVFQKKCDAVIMNETTKEALIRQIEECLKKSRQ